MTTGQQSKPPDTRAPMKCIVLHRNGTMWMNNVGNSLHVPFINAYSVEEAVEEAIRRAGKAQSYLVIHPKGWAVVRERSGWAIEAVS